MMIAKSMVGVAIAALFGIYSMCGCQSVGSDKQEFERVFKISLPEHLHYVNYEVQKSLIDRSFVWQISPADNKFIVDLCHNTGLVCWDKDNKPAKVAAGLLSYDWPKWWNQDYIYALKEVYGRVEGDSRWFIWVDREKDTIYAQHYNV